MGAIQLSDELQQMIERQVAAGRASNPAAFLEEAVLRLIEDTHAEEQESAAVAKVGIADIEAGLYVTIATLEDEERLYERIMARLRANLSVQE